MPDTPSTSGAKPTRKTPAKRKPPTRKPAAKATGATKRPYVRRTSTRPPAMDMLTGNPVTPAEDNLLHRLSDADIAVVNFWIKNGNYIASPTSPSYDTPLT